MKKSIKILNYVQLALSILTMLLFLTLRLDKNENAYLPSGILWLPFFVYDRIFNLFNIRVYSQE